MPRNLARPARQVVPLKAAISSGKSAPVVKRDNRPAETHPLRRADDVPARTATGRGATVATARLMTDWPVDKAWENRVKRHLRAPVWYSRPYLLAALWGRLPSAPRK